MDDWHRRLVKELVKETPAGVLPDSAASLEIGFGQARSALTYMLELARAHRIPATGTVTGDDLWLQLGEGRLRFTLNRREGCVIAVRPGHEDVQIRPGGADLGAMAREAIDALVAAWRSGPPQLRTPSAPPPEFEDEPTKG